MAGSSARKEQEKKREVKEKRKLKSEHITPSKAFIEKGKPSSACKDRQSSAKTKKELCESDSKESL